MFFGALDPTEDYELVYMVRDSRRGKCGVRGKTGTMPWSFHGPSGVVSQHSADPQWQIKNLAIIG